ncbi:MAG TPA: sigma-70 family RNA polymerase sigma factor [Pedobacter sp.]|nr:sigma-70 family RNA polymerase sigma factor [Pedobacter sp.]
MQQKQTDEDLITEVLAGNTKAYSVLVARHQRFVFSLALRFAKRREDAEEIAQDCFVKAYRSLGTFHMTSRFSTWLYTITYTTAMSFLRKKRLDTQSIDDEGSRIQLESRVSDFNANLAERKSTVYWLNQAIDQLTPDDAAVITLFYQGEQNLEEIGAALNMDPNNVKVRLHRARTRLKEKLQVILKDEVKELL